jgi:predicted dehydrogenase
MYFAYALPRPGYEGYVAFRGSRGSLKIAQSGDLEFVGPGDVADPVLAERHAIEVADVPGYGAGGRAMLADLVSAIREGRDPLVTDMDMLRALELMDAIYQSASTGRRVRLGA